MKPRVKFLSDWGAFKKGETYEVTEDMAKALVDANVAELVVEDDVPESVRKLVSAQIEQIMQSLKTGIHTEIEKLVKNGKLADGQKASFTIQVGSPEDNEDPKGGFKSLGHFAHDIFKAGRDGRGASKTLREWEAKAPAASGHVSEGDDAYLGYLVPTEFRNTLLQNALDVSVVAPDCTPMPMAVNSIRVPYIAESTRVGSTHGGIVIYRPDEAGQKTASRPKVGQLELRLKKLAGLCYASDELLEDSPISVEATLKALFGAAIAFVVDDDIINGTGAGMALGVLTAPCLIAVAKEAAQANTTIVAENVIKMYSRMNPSSHSRAVWLANANCFPQLATMTINVGTGGVPVWLPANGVAGAPNGTLFGRPLRLTEHCQTLGTQGDIVYGDFSQYLLGQKAGQGLSPKFASSIHLRFDYDEVAFRFVLRYDGQPWWASAVTPKRGTSFSPFVTLAGRP